MNEDTEQSKASLDMTPSKSLKEIPVKQPKSKAIEVVDQLNNLNLSQESLQAAPPGVSPRNQYGKVGEKDQFEGNEDVHQHRLEHLAGSVKSKWAL